MAKARRKRGLKGLSGFSCANVKWRCESRNACYAAVGKGKSIYGYALLRAECLPHGKCKAEVMVGQVIVARNRNLQDMQVARDWACNKMRGQ